MELLFLGTDLQWTCLMVHETRRVYPCLRSCPACTLRVCREVHRLLPRSLLDGDKVEEVWAAIQQSVAKESER
jgi:hypothetical protein